MIEPYLRQAAFLPGVSHVNVDTLTLSRRSDRASEEIRISVEGRLNAGWIPAFALQQGSKTFFVYFKVVESTPMNTKDENDKRQATKAGKQALEDVKNLLGRIPG